MPIENLVIYFVVFAVILGLTLVMVYAFSDEFNGREPGPRKYIPIKEN